MKSEIKAVLSGLATFLPGYSGLKETGGANSARYCYSVWLRHLILTHEFRQEKMPINVAELGPGASIGVGLAALLSGAERYFAVDVVSFADKERNLAILEELVGLFKRRDAIPNDKEFANIKPTLEDYQFPAGILDGSSLGMSLSDDRLSKITASIANQNTSVSLKTQSVFYTAPWHDPNVIAKDSINFLISQAVMEHVSDLDNVYRNCWHWLEPGGVMSHQIDFKSHGKSKELNGCWKYSDSMWKIIVGKRPFLINRVPLSKHLNILRICGFIILKVVPVKTSNSLKPEQLAKRYKELNQDDLTTSGALVVAMKPFK